MFARPGTAVIGNVGSGSFAFRTKRSFVTCTKEERKTGAIVPPQVPTIRVMYKEYTLLIWPKPMVSRYAWVLG